MSNISAAATAAREQARTKTGEFGAQEHPESDVSLDAPVERAFADAPDAFTRRYDSVEDKVAAFKEELDQAVSALADDENWLNYLDVMSRFHRYSPTNQMLIQIQTGGRATRVAGFRAWQEKFGRSVNKGEKAIGIFAPRTISMTVKDSNGKPVKDEKGKVKKERRMIGFTTTSVFDISQTSGPDLPEIERELSEEPPEGFVDDMVLAAQKAGYEVEFRKMGSHAAGSAQGWTDPHSKKIVVDASLTPGSQAATLAHELGHVHAGHTEPDAMGQYHTGPGGCRGRFEVEADSVAYALQRSNGVKPGQATKLSAQYVAGWSRRDPEVLKESADTVSKALKSILDSTPFRNLAD